MHVMIFAAWSVEPINNPPGAYNLWWGHTARIQTLVEYEKGCGFGRNRSRKPRLFASGCKSLLCGPTYLWIFTLWLLLFSHAVMSDSVVPWTPGHQTSLSLTISQSLLQFLSIASVMPSSHLILWCPLLLLPSMFPSIRDCPMSWLFSSDDQHSGVSAPTSVLPMSIQGWFPLRLAGLISLPSQGLLGFFSSTTVWRHQFFGSLPSLWSSSHNCTWPLGSP